MKFENGSQFGVGFVVVVGFGPRLAEGTFPLLFMLLFPSANDKNISLYTEKRKETIKMDRRTNIYVHALDLDHLSC